MSKSVEKEQIKGQILADRYKIIEEVGQGGMGIVYKAEHLLMKRIVAIKMLLEDLTANELMRKRFEKEAQAISALNHPNIMTVFDFGIANDNKPYLVVEYLEGKNLNDLIKETKFVPVTQALNIFKQMCAGLGHAHEKGIIHRDIKPSNFMLIEMGSQKDFVKIVDFGIAKLLLEKQKEAIGLTTTGEIFGSPLYMSPEQCSGNPVDARSDIYSLGCVMYFMLTGASPFTAGNVPECLYKQVHEAARPFGQVNPEASISPELEKIVLKTMAKEPNDRFQSMLELEKELDKLISPASNESKSSITTTNEPEVKTNNEANEILPQTPSATQSPILQPVFHKSPIAIAIIMAITLGLITWIINTQNNPMKVYSTFIDKGNTYYNQGNYTEAEKYFNLALQQSQQIPNGKPQTASTVESLCQTYFAEEKYDKLLALALLEQRYDSATNLLNQALQKVQAKYGANSPQTFNILSDLAKLYEKQGNLAKAEEFYSKALAGKGGSEKRIMQEHLIAVKKQKKLQAKKTTVKATESSTAQAEDTSNATGASNTTDNSEEKEKKKGIVKRIGSGFAKVFGIFGHHKKDNN